MSVIVDATKFQRPDDVTDHDFMAVEVVAENETMMTQTLMTKKESEYHVVEQDYEDEMTATQALNLEIAHAVAELNAEMEIEGLNKTDDETSSLPLASVTELDATAQMPTRNDEISSPDDTVESEAITASTIADEDTVEMPAEKGKTG